MLQYVAQYCNCDCFSARHSQEGAEESVPCSDNEGEQGQGPLAIVQPGLQNALLDDPRHYLVPATRKTVVR